MAGKLPKIEAIKDRRGRVVFHFDPASVPSRSASLGTRLQFAAAYFERFIVGGFATQTMLRTCAGWVREGAARFGNDETAIHPRIKATCGDCGKPYNRGHDCPEGRRNRKQVQHEPKAKVKATKGRTEAKAKDRRITAR